MTARWTPGPVIAVDPADPTPALLWSYDPDPAPDFPPAVQVGDSIRCHWHDGTRPRVRYLIVDHVRETSPGYWEATTVPAPPGRHRAPGLAGWPTPFVAPRRRAEFP